MSKTIYVFDTAPFFIMLDYYGDVFMGFWLKLKGAVDSKIVTSVAEVKVEIEGARDERKKETDFILEWLPSDEEIFTAPSDEEIKIMEEVLGKAKEITGKSQFDATYLAGPFVVAKALNIKRSTGNDVVVVTRKIYDRYERRNEGLFAVCKRLGLKVIELEEFMADMGWKFK